ncbi:MAG: type II toxin-antitoxin system death-on-curing family toxin [Gammaproteobacteria bacterium]|nr:MAG: type II toxin-antitoxin system death-on-curing family toxin [Gammaproteobacteria bacterium]
MTEPIWIANLEVLAVHDRQLAEHGGAAGVRDIGLLETAIARPQQLHAYGDPDIFDLAAAYTFGIVQNHPFVDGNKRTGFITGILFVELNGRRFTASEPDATQAVLDLAIGEMREGEFAAWLRENTQ